MQNLNKSNQLLSEQVHNQCDYNAYKYGGGQGEVEGKVILLYVYVAWKFSYKRDSGAKCDGDAYCYKEESYDDE